MASPGRSRLTSSALTGRSWRLPAGQSRVRASRSNHPHSSPSSGPGTITSDGSGRPPAEIPHKTSNARTLRHNNLVVLPQPIDAVDSSHPQLAQWVAVGDPTLVGRL